MSETSSQINKKIVILLSAFWMIALLHLCRPPGAPGAEYDRQNAVVKAVRKVSPAVVNISSEYEIRKRVSPFSGFGIDPFFDSFFKDFFDPGFERHQKRTSLGSGVIIDGKRGFILTNAHVIQKAGAIAIVLNDEREFAAQIVGADPDSDLAVLRITTEDRLPAIEMGNSADLMIGETVIAIGNPFGFSNTVTTGVISATNRSIRTDGQVYRNFIQIDASINPGNSGGPLLNINGELIGINTAIYAKAQGIGFAIPIDKAKRIISDLIQYGEVVQAWIGIRLQNLDARLAHYLKVPEIKGVLIKEVDPIGPAKKSGIRDGDILLSIESQTIHSLEDYQSILKSHAAGKSLRMQLWRNGRSFEVSVKSTVFPAERAMDLAHELLGITVEDLSFKNRLGYGSAAKEGVVITALARTSYLSRIGSKPGDVIRQIDEVIIKNTKDFKKAILKYRQKKSLVILLQRGDQLYYITVKL